MYTFNRVWLCGWCLPCIHTWLRHMCYILVCIITCINTCRTRISISNVCNNTLLYASNLVGRHIIYMINMNVIYFSNEDLLHKPSCRIINKSPPLARGQRIYSVYSSPVTYPNTVARAPHINSVYCSEVTYPEGLGFTGALLTISHHLQK